jgi:hypothetical protein
LGVPATIIDFVGATTNRKNFAPELQPVFSASSFQPPENNPISSWPGFVPAIHAFFA